MKLTLVLVFLYLLYAGSPAIVNETLQGGERLPGIWTNTFDNSLNGLPSNYFLCGYSLLQSVFKVFLQNCRCGRRWYRGRIRYRCNWCENIFDLQASGMSLYFCRDNKWQDQILKKFQTSSPNKQYWRSPIMCPPNTYVNGWSQAFGLHHGVWLGMHGLRLKCSTKDLKHFNMPEDRMTYYTTPMRNSIPGNFVSGVQLYYQNGGILLGWRTFLEPIVLIDRVVFQYKNNQKMINSPVVLETIKVRNNAPNRAVKTINFSKTAEGMGRWQVTQLPEYTVGEGIVIDPPAFDKSEDQSQFKETFKKVTQKFGFNQQIKTTISSTQGLSILVSPFSELTISTVISQRRGTVSFIGKIYFVNAFDKKKVIMQYNISGNWIGITHSSATHTINQNKIQKKQSEGNGGGGNMKRQDQDKNSPTPKNPSTQKDNNKNNSNKPSQNNSIKNNNTDTGNTITSNTDKNEKKIVSSDAENVQQNDQNDNDGEGRESNWVQEDQPAQKDNTQINLRK